MKKFVLLMALMLLCSCPLAQARFIPHAYAELSKTKAQELAFQYCEDKLGYSKDNIKVKQYAGDKDGWAFSFTIKEADPTSNGMIVVHMDGNGHLTEIIGPQPLPLYQQVCNDWDKKKRDYNAVYQFQIMWKSALATIPAEEQAEFENNAIRMPILAFLDHEVGLPTEDDITYEEAVQKAEDAILALPGWTPDMLAALRIQAEMYHVPIQYEHPVYQFVYSTIDHVEYEEAVVNGTIGSFHYETKHDQVKKAFGEAYPNHVNIRIDARTGEVVGDIYVQYQGYEFVCDSMAFFLWEANKNEPDVSEGMGGPI